MYGFDGSTVAGGLRDGLGLPISLHIRRFRPVANGHRGPRPGSTAQFLAVPERESSAVSNLHLF